VRPHVDPLEGMRLRLCAGIYTSINTMSCLAHVFEQENALDKLEAFASLNGPAWYGLPANEETIAAGEAGQPVAFPAEDRHRGWSGDRVRSDVPAALGCRLKR
jgi:dihydroorotase